MAVREPASPAGVADLLARLRVMAKGRETIDVAQLHFVDLGKIRKAYGPRWREQGARIEDAAESFLRKRLSSSDLLVKGEGGFLVVMGTATGPESYAVAAQLTQGLNAFFTGEHPQAQVRFGSHVQSMATRDIERDLASAQRTESPEQIVSGAEHTASDLEWKFEPVWDVRRETLSYWFVAPFNAATGLRLPGYQFETVGGHAKQFIDIDEAGLWVAEQALVDLSAAGKQALVGATVHIHSLVSMASRARILATIDRLDANLHRFRIVKIAGVSQGFPRIYLKEIIGSLRARVPNVILQASWDEPDFSTLLYPGLAGIGIVSPGSAVQPGSITEIPALISRSSEAVRLAHGARIRFFVEGAVTKYLALKFTRIGVDNLASTGIWPARSVVDGMERWPARRLAA